ncbi:MAG: hypothetical protein ABIF10_04245 [Candidatus Woesearchaeota archaeon]
MPGNFFEDIGEYIGEVKFCSELIKNFQQYSDNKKLPEHLLPRIQKKWNKEIPIRDKPFIIKYLKTEYDLCIQRAETIIVKALDGENSQIDQAQEFLKRAKSNQIYVFSIGGPGLHNGVDQQDLYARILFYIHNFPEKAKQLNGIETQIRNAELVASQEPGRTAESLREDRNQIIADYYTKHPIQD